MVNGSSTVEARPAGGSGLHLSALGMGCWSFGGGEYWGPSDQDAVDRVVRRAVELGVTYFDTAEAYNEGRSEESLGLALRGIPRDRVVVGSKVLPTNLYPERVVASCEGSLRRLGVDYIDLYMIHWPIRPSALRFFTSDPEVLERPPTLEPAVEALLRLREQGKIRHIGVSNFSVRWLDLAQQCGLVPAVNQLAYNLLSRAIEFEVLDQCRQRGIGVIGYSTLMQGLLADVWATLDEVPEWQRRTRHFSHAGSPRGRHGEEGAEPETARALAEIRAIAREHGVSMTALAIAWAVRDPAVTSALVGARSVAKLEENARGASLALSAETVRRLDEATRPVMAKLGPALDYYESVENDRTL